MKKVKQAPLAIVVCGDLNKTLEGNLPDHLIPLNTLIIGYPKEMVKAKDKWKEENVRRIK